MLRQVIHQDLELDVPLLQDAAGVVQALRRDVDFPVGLGVAQGVEEAIAKEVLKGGGDGGRKLPDLGGRVQV